MSLWQNTTGGPALAKGGSGDVLTGLIAGLWVQIGQQGGWTTQSAQQAALCGVYIHGLAGDLAAQIKSAYGVLATDILFFIPPAFKRVARKEK